MIVKSNPLFHDSTVTQGANVQTQFELKGLTLKDGQAVCLKLIVAGEARFIEMTKKGESIFHTSAWIEHRKRISYQFFIQTGGDLVQASEIKQSLALHTVSELWNPVSGDEWKKDFQNNPSLERNDLSFVEGSEEPKEKEDFLDNLINKWDL